MISHSRSLHFKNTTLFCLLRISLTSTPSHLPDTLLKHENFLHRPAQKLPSNAQKHTSRQMKRSAKYYLSWKKSFASHTPNLILHLKLSLPNLNSRQRFSHNLFSTLSTNLPPPLIMHMKLISLSQTQFFLEIFIFSHFSFPLSQI